MRLIIKEGVTNSMITYNMKLPWLVLVITLFQVTLGEEQQSQGSVVIGNTGNIDNEDQNHQWFQTGTADTPNKENDNRKPDQNVGKISKDGLGLIGSDVQKGTYSNKQAAEFGTKMGKAVFHCAVEMGKLGVDASASLTNKGLDIIQNVGKVLLPNILSSGLGELITLSHKNVNKAKDLSKVVLGNVDEIGQKGINLANGQKVSDVTNNIVQNGVRAVESRITKRPM